MPTLAELAQQQITNPANAWLASQQQNPQGALNTGAPANVPGSSNPLNPGAVLANAGQNVANTVNSPAGQALMGAAGKVVDPLDVAGKAGRAVMGTHSPPQAGVAGSPGALGGGPPLAPGEEVPTALARPDEKPLQTMGGAGVAGPNPGQELVRSEEETGKGIEERANQSIAEANRTAEFTAKGVEASESAKQRADLLQKADDATIRTHQRDATYAQSRRAAELEQEAAEAREMHVDPQKWFKDKGTAGSIVAALAMGAGAFGANMPHSGGQNAAQKIIDGAVERNTDAQKADIQNKWKAVGFKADQDTEKYAHEQFTINQERESNIRGFHQAIALADSQLQGSNLTAQAQQNLMKIKDALGDKIAGTHQEIAKTRYDVAMKERAAAAAAANKQAELAKEKREYEIKINASPDHQLSEKARALGMTREEALHRHVNSVFDGDRSNAGLIEVSKEGKGDANALKDQKSNEAIQAYGALGEKAAAGATVGNAVLSHLPRWLAPGANMAQDDVNLYNNTALPQVLKGLEARMSPEQVEQQKQALTISSTMPDAEKRQRIAALQNIAHAGQAFKTGKGTAEAVE